MAGQYTDKKNHTNNDAGEEPGWSCRIGSCHNLGNTAGEGQQDSQHSPDHPGDHQAGHVRTDNNIIYVYYNRNMLLINILSSLFENIKALVDKTLFCKQCCGSGMFIPDPGSDPDFCPSIFFVAT